MTDLAAPNPEVSDDDVALMTRVMAAAAKYPNMLPGDFLGHLVDFVQASRLSIPIGQVTGFSQFTMQTKSGSFTPSSVSATSPADPADGAFTLSALPKGRYAFFYGARLGVPSGGNGNTVIISLFYSPAAALFDSSPRFKNTWDGATALKSDITVDAIGLALFDLSQDNNSISLKANIASASPTCTIGDRWISALRYANL